MTQTLDLIIRNETLLGYRQFPGAINIQGLWIAPSGFGFTEIAQAYFYFEIIKDDKISYLFNTTRAGQLVYPATLSRQMGVDFNTARRFMFLLTKCKEAWQNVQQYEWANNNNNILYLDSSDFQVDGMQTPPPPYL